MVLALSALLVPLSAQDLHTDPASTPWLAQFWKTEPTLKSLLRQTLDIRVASPDSGRSLLVPQAWSLSVELVLSLLVPLGAVAAGRSTAWFIGCAWIAAIFAGMSVFCVHFALGIVLAKHFRDIVGWLEPRPATRAVLAIAGLIFYTYNNYQFQGEIAAVLRLGILAQAIGSALFIAVAASTPGLRAWLSRGLVHHIGQISYSIYLIHMLILMCLTPRVLAVVGTSIPALSWFVGLVFTVTSSIIISGPLYRCVEMPTMALGKRLGGAGRRQRARTSRASTRANRPDFPR
jgi:peptidoglycan/LPS O-acetylase OafA/YrhL